MGNSRFLSDKKEPLIANKPNLISKDLRKLDPTPTELFPKVR